MPTWKIQNVTDEPNTRLYEWRVFEVQQPGREERTRHFFGNTGRPIEGRVSSAIVQFDPATRRGKTESGRVYELVGRGSGLGLDAEYTWNIWRGHAEAVDVVDVTAEIENVSGAFGDKTPGELLVELSEFVHRRNADVTTPPKRRGNITTGPERTVLRPMTPEQLTAYKLQRLADSEGKK